MRISYVAAATVAGLGLLALAVSLVRLWPVGRPAAAEQQRSLVARPAIDHPVVDHGRYTLTQDGSIVGAAIANALPRDMDFGDVRARDTLSEATRGAFAAYLAERGSEFDAYLESMGVAPIHAGSTGDSSVWKGFRKTIAKAQFDPSSIRVRSRIRGGVAVPIPDDGSVTLTSERPAARPPWAQSPMQASEVVVDGLFQGYFGEEFEGRFGLEFAYDQKSGRWVLVRARMYGVPPGVLVVGPPA